MINKMVRDIKPIISSKAETLIYDITNAYCRGDFTQAFYSLVNLKRYIEELESKIATIKSIMNC